MPAHDVYIEPFWGRGTIAQRKRPARFTIGIDLDPDAIASGRDVALMFRTDGVQWLANYFRLPLTGDRATVDPEAATGAAESRGRRRSMNSAARPGGNGEAAGAAGNGDRVRTAELCDPAAGCACTFGGVPWERHFVYLDPPYLATIGRGYYAHELTEEQHRVLCRLFLRLPCPAALSGYPSDVYAAELGDCRSIAMPTVNRAGKRCVEVLWMNFQPPSRYHDTRFVGISRRERERIRRRIRNWAAGLKRMPAAERQAIFEACAAEFAAARAIGES